MVSQFLGVHFRLRRSMSYTNSFRLVEDGPHHSKFAAKSLNASIKLADDEKADIFCRLLCYIQG